MEYILRLIFEEILTLKAWNLMISVIGDIRN